MNTNQTIVRSYANHRNLQTNLTSNHSDIKHRPDDNVNISIYL